MQQHPFGPLAPVSTLTLGGGGLGMLWGATTFEECVATVHAAVAAGITLFDLAPRYGDGKAEEVVGEAFDGHLPAGVRVTSKCNLGNPPPDEIEPTLRRSIHVRPVFEKLVAEGLIGAWGLTGIGHPDTIIRLLSERPAPAAVQCIANLLNSPGGLKFFNGRAKPRAIMAAAHANGVGVMGIRAVQAGALTAAIDRPLPDDHPEVHDFARAAGFRQLCAELGENPAVIAHRYALSLEIDTLVLGVKNRQELAECVAAANAGPLPPELIARIDATVAE
jgi:aryl-alcohol dehydrogenase-like predicted oxidoreductase